MRAYMGFFAAFISVFYLVGFGMLGYFRISFCVDDKTLEGSLEGFRAAIGRFR